MKQNISLEQLNELSEKGKERLREWWKPKEGDWCVDKDGDKQVIEDVFDSSLTHHDYFEIVLPATPLLSIGQMIEFLDEREIEYTAAGWYLSSSKKAYPYQEELCDALFKAVKEVLERET